MKLRKTADTFTVILRRGGTFTNMENILLRTQMYSGKMSTCALSTCSYQMNSGRWFCRTFLTACSRATQSTFTTRDGTRIMRGCVACLLANLYKLRRWERQWPSRTSVIDIFTFLLKISSTSWLHQLKYSKILISELWSTMQMALPLQRGLCVRASRKSRASRWIVASIHHKVCFRKAFAD